MHFSVRRFAPIHIHHWVVPVVGYPPPQMSPSCEATGALKRTQFFHIFKHVNYINYMKLKFQYYITQGAHPH